MNDLIEREEAKAWLKSQLYATAINNIGLRRSVDEVYAEIAQNRIEDWVDAIPSAKAQSIIEHSTRRDDNGVLWVLGDNDWEKKEK